MLNSSLATNHMMTLSQLSQGTNLMPPNMSVSPALVPGQQTSQPSSGSSPVDHDLSADDKSADNKSTSAADSEAETVSTAVTEEVTPVNPKTQAKALRPPVTIKNFFKPTNQDAVSLPGTSKLTNRSDNENISKVNNSESSKTSVENSETKGKIITRRRDSDNSRTMKKEMSYSEFLELQNDTEKIDECSDDTANESAIDTSACKTVKETKTKSDLVVLDENSNDSSSGSSQLTKSSSKQTSSKKRKLENKSSDQPAKKAKQVTLKSTFAKMESKSVTCPICSKVFEKGISNEALNQHIDNCIIE